MVELLSVLALASKQIKQGRFSKCAVTHTRMLSVTQYIYLRETHKKVARGERDRSCSPKIGSIDPGRGSDNCRTDIGCGS